MKFNNLEDCIKWVRSITPFAIKPVRKTKRSLVVPFTSANAFDVVTKCIAEALYKRLTKTPIMNKLKPVRCDNCKFYVVDKVYKSEGTCTLTNTYTKGYWICDKLPTDEDRRNAKINLHK